MIKFLISTGLACSLLALAQSPSLAPPPSWRTRLQALPPAPPADTTAKDILQFERNMRMAASYLGTAAPNANVAQWEANRALVRSMATYLYGLRVLSANPQLRGPILRAQRSFDSLAFAPYLEYGMPTGNSDAGSLQPVAVPPQPEMGPASPPFALTAPESNGVSDADKDLAADLRTRYETDAAHSAGIWQNAEQLRISLEAQAMGLNVTTATSMSRLPQDFSAAANALRRNDWEDARTRLQQAEAETDKIAKTVGH